MEGALLCAPGPLVEGPAGGDDGLVHVGLVALCDTEDLLPSAGVLDGQLGG
jgi:hypothetical protein